MVELLKKMITGVTGPITNLSIIKHSIYCVVDQESDYVYYFSPTVGATVYATGAMSSVHQFENCSWLEVLVTMGLSQSQVMQLIANYKTKSKC